MGTTVSAAPRLGRRNAKRTGLGRFTAKVPAVLAYPVLVAVAYVALVSIWAQLDAIQP